MATLGGMPVAAVRAHRPDPIAPTMPLGQHSMNRPETAGIAVPLLVVTPTANPANPIRDAECFLAPQDPCDPVEGSSEQDRTGRQ